MYASTTVGHDEMPDPIHVTTPHGRVSIHLPDLYLSFTPDEADRLAAALLRGAATVRAQQQKTEVAA